MLTFFRFIFPARWMTSDRPPIATRSQSIISDNSIFQPRDRPPIATRSQSIISDNSNFNYNSSSTNNKPHLHTKLLIYLAIQTAVIAFLWSHYAITLPDVSPVRSWIGERLNEISFLRFAWTGLQGVRQSIFGGESSTVRKSKIKSPSTASSSSSASTTSRDLSHLPVFTKEQLSLFDGSRPSKDVCLAILGRVFNVQKGKKHYGPGGGYHGFAGKDGTRAFVSGDFTEKGLIDDVSGLGHQDLLGIDDWLTFYEKDYELIGLLQGTYYDANGHGTEALRKVEQALAEAKAWKSGQTKESEIFPPCNSEWHKDSGGRVWCSTKSGGINRKWAGVPRKLFNPGSKNHRCACVKNFGTPLSFEESAEKKNRGDLDNPNLQEYPNCTPTSNSCRLPQD